METKETYALIRDIESKLGYFIMNKEHRSFLMIDDNDEAQKIINTLINEKGAIFDDLNSFFVKYPNFTSEERMSRSKKNLEEMLAAAKTKKD